MKELVNVLFVASNTNQFWLVFFQASLSQGKKKKKILRDNGFPEVGGGIEQPRHGRRNPRIIQKIARAAVRSCCF